MSSSLVNKDTASKINSSNLKTCDVPFCEKQENPTTSFDHTNITCWTCKKFTCSSCTEQIWKGEWNEEIFFKPTFVLPGLKHEVWKCPFCNSTFDRMRRTRSIAIACFPG